jgi:hypothetical protein
MKIYQFEGVAKWAQFKRLDKFDKYSIQLYVGKNTNDAIKALKLKSRQKEDEDGTFWSFTLNPATSFQKTVEVVDAEGNPFEGLIGNGSKVRLEVEVYPFDNDFGKGNGSRLRKCTVLDLVPYEEKLVEVVAPPADDIPEIRFQVPVDEPEEVPAKGKRGWK